MVYSMNIYWVYSTCCTKEKEVHDLILAALDLAIGVSSCVFRVFKSVEHVLVVLRI